ncbi:hypothetical protein LCGC14_1252410 [marine sediment metagenome]|uniref:Uncharacterized protein n=1 Tax=marine sediment metagenome TaxID=412755 RepID=A0A0F9L622_9ZZZZ
MDGSIYNWLELIGDLIIVYRTESEIFEPSYPEEEVIEFAEHSDIVKIGE